MSVRGRHPTIKNIQTKTHFFFRFVGGNMLPSAAALKFPPAGFAPIPFATAPLAPGQFLHAPIFYWPLYPSPPVSPTGYYMQGPPVPPLGPHQGQGGATLQQQPQLVC